MWLSDSRAVPVPVRLLSAREVREDAPQARAGRDSLWEAPKPMLALCRHVERPARARRDRTCARVRALNFPSPRSRILGGVWVRHGACGCRSERAHANTCVQLALAVSEKSSAGAFYKVLKFTNLIT
jgi:hypothetical protein